ncbi:unnamed protein product [Dovyalis caffra]|uniref:Uncharacterized protein n=1 Tax=Dovyalis caffra TaxID=77055 RepID=A0AAV1STE7_9ROSI|nr:unnamed protein product [Dovyalis caffra]
MRQRFQNTEKLVEPVPIIGLLRGAMSIIFGPMVIIQDTKDGQLLSGPNPICPTQERSRRCSHYYLMTCCNGIGR